MRSRMMSMMMGPSARRAALAPACPAAATVTQTSSPASSMPRVTCDGRFAHSSHASIAPAAGTTQCSRPLPALAESRQATR